MDFFVRNGPMLDATSDDEEFSFFEPNITVTKFHSKPTFHDQE